MGAYPVPIPVAGGERDDRSALGHGFRPDVALLTGGADKPYAIGMADCLIQQGLAFDFIGSDEVNAPVLHTHPLVRFLNLRGDQRSSVSLPRKVLRVALYYLRLLRYAATSRAAVFHILWNNTLEHFDRTLLMAYYRSLGKRLVLTAHNVNSRQRDGGDNWWNRLTLRVQYALAHHILVHTESMRRELISDFGVSPNKASVIPFGINRTLPDTALTSGEARKRLGLPPTARVILFFGNIARYKGLEYLLQAAAQLQPTSQDYRWIIAGRPKGCPQYWAELEQRIRDLHLTPRMTLRIGFVPDAEVEVFFKAADLAALPYTHIYQSGVLFLAYSFGLPVIAADVGQLREDVIEGKTGYMCRPRDAGDLARAISAYFDSELHRELEQRRQEIRRYAEHRYSWEQVGQITRRIYAGLIAE